MAAPFEAAIEIVCNSLRTRGMRLVGQLDVSGRLEQSLAISVPPCRLLFVLPGPNSLSTDTIHPWAAVFLPLHVVISGNEIESEVRIPNSIQADASAAPPATYSPVLELQRELFDALESVAVRSSVLR